MSRKPQKSEPASCTDLEEPLGRLKAIALLLRQLDARSDPEQVDYLIERVCEDIDLAAGAFRALARASTGVGLPH